MKFSTTYQQHEVGISANDFFNFAGNCGKAVFQCFCLPTEGVSCDLYPWCIWSHHTGPQPPHAIHCAPPRTGPWPHPLLVKSGGKIYLLSWGSPLQLMLTFSGWLLKHIRWGSRLYAFYWNAFYVIFNVLTHAWWRMLLNLLINYYVSKELIYRDQSKKI